MHSVLDGMSYRRSNQLTWFDLCRQTRPGQTSRYNAYDCNCVCARARRASLDATIHKSVGKARSRKLRKIKHHGHKYGQVRGNKKATNENPTVRVFIATTMQARDDVAGGEGLRIEVSTIGAEGMMHGQQMVIVQRELAVERAAAQALMTHPVACARASPHCGAQGDWAPALVAGSRTTAAGLGTTR